MLLAAVFLLSLSSLAYEILLTRIFSISQWNHLSFMVISIALLGFGAGGIALSILDTRVRAWEKKLASEGALTECLILYAASAVLAAHVLTTMPLDYFRLPSEPFQAVYLLTAYLMPAIPFFFTGVIISLAFSNHPEKSGVVYLSTMTGSAAGAALPCLLLPLFGEGRLIALVSILPLLLAAFKKKETARLAGIALRSPAALAILLLSALLLVARPDSPIRVHPSQYKALSVISKFPGTKIEFSTTGIRGRIDRAQTPHHRFAPGLSLKFTGSMPEQRVIYRDGDQGTVLYGTGSEKRFDFSTHTLSYAGYLANPNPREILLITGGGGLSVPCALSSGAARITIIEPHPTVARYLKDHYGIEVHGQNPRAFLASETRRFHVIHVENWGTSLPGTESLSQEFLFTEEALTAYLAHLKPDGILIISRKLLLPPSDSVRMWATLYRTLKKRGHENPEQHLVMLRNWDTYTVLASRKQIRNFDVIRDFSRRMNFDLIHSPRMEAGMINRFNVFDEPWHHTEIMRLSKHLREGRETAYHKSSLVDVTPQTDKRPYHYRFLKWSRARDLYAATGARFYGMMLSGEIVVPVIFLETLALAGLLLLLPLLFIQRKEARLPPKGLLYFLSLGAGFIMAELFFIKTYTLLLGDPVVSLMVVLTGLLLFSGVGGLISQQMSQHHIWQAIAGTMAILGLVNVSHGTVIQAMLRLPEWLRYLGALLLLIPPGIIMGLPFSPGMRFLTKNPTQRAYAWAANGCASVLASILSQQLAMSIGIPAILTAAMGAYMAAFLCSGPFLKPETAAANSA